MRSTTSRDKSYIKDISLLSAQKVPEKSIVLVNDRAAFYYLTSEAAHLTVCFKNIRKIDKKELGLKKIAAIQRKYSQKYFNKLYSF